MTNINVTVGVFNVLANGVSYCSPLWQSQTVYDNKSKIFNALQGLTLGVINSNNLYQIIKSTTIESGSLGVPSLIKAKFPPKTFKLNQFCEYHLINHILNVLRNSDYSVEPKKDFLIGLKLLQFIEDIYTNVETKELTTEEKIKKIENFNTQIEYTNIKKSYTNIKKSLETFIINFNELVKETETEKEKLLERYDTILKEAASSGGEGKPDDILFIIRLVKSIKNTKDTKSKYTTYGKLIKGWLQTYANKTGFGLFGGFMVGGGPHKDGASSGGEGEPGVERAGGVASAKGSPDGKWLTWEEHAALLEAGALLAPANLPQKVEGAGGVAALQDSMTETAVPAPPKVEEAGGVASAKGSQNTPWDMYNKEHQATFFQRKLDFIKRQIDAFFSDPTKGPMKILVCPEFDYRHEVIKDIVANTKIKYINSLGKRDVPCVANVRVGPPEPILPSCDANSSQTGKGGNTFSMSDNNFCRVVFYSGNIKHKVYEEHDTQYGEGIKKVKLASGGGTEKKETIDVISFDTIHNEHAFDLFALHLNSTTSLDNGILEEEKEASNGNKPVKFTDVGKKINEIKALAKVIKISQDRGRNVIVAGDFNFPLANILKKIEKDIPPSDGAFGKKLYGFDSELLTANRSNFDENIKLWDNLNDVLNINDEDQYAGNVTKSRFTNQMGNDQLWEGKGEERKYNTDFIGYISTTNQENPQLKDTFTDTLKKLLYTKNGYVPYLAKDPKNDWLSDHALVYKTINLKVTSSRPNHFGVTLRETDRGRSFAGFGGGMKYIRNRRNIKSRGNRRNSKKTRRNRRKSIGKRRKTRRKIKSKRHSRKYKRL